jgi:hypothetical protein
MFSGTAKAKKSISLGGARRQVCGIAFKVNSSHVSNFSSSHVLPLLVFRTNGNVKYRLRSCSALFDAGLLECVQ